MPMAPSEFTRSGIRIGNLILSSLRATSNRRNLRRYIIHDTPYQMRPPGIQLGSILGTTLTLQPGFLVLGGLFVLLDLESKVPIQRALLWLPVLFISILLHELGHAGAFAALGHGPSHVLLTSFGGLTINRGHTRPWQDMVTSLAGPFTSFVIAGISLVAMVSVTTVKSDPMLQVLVPLLAQSNVLWGLFNLMPIHPLDGGQALRSLVQTFASEKTATSVSIWSSLAIAVTMIVAGVMQKWFFLAIVAGLMLMHNYQRLQIRKREEASREDGEVKTEDEDVRQEDEE